jgi:hypothetical protein
MIGNDENRPRRNVLARHYSVEVYQWKSPRHRCTQSDIVAMVGIIASVAVP